VLQVTPFVVAAAGRWSGGAISGAESAVDALSNEMKREETATNAVIHPVLRVRQPFL
jgi:hypothetical protein